MDMDMERYEDDLMAWEEEQVYLDQALEANEPMDDDFETEPF